MPPRRLIIYAGTKREEILATLVFSLGASAIFAAVASFAGGDRILTTYLILATLASIVHLAILNWRRWQGDMWYSYYDGTSWAYTVTRRAWPSLNEGTVQRFLEPTPGFLLAFIFYTTGRPALALFFLAIVGASMIGTNLRLQEQRHQWLDLIDSQLVGRYMPQPFAAPPPRPLTGSASTPAMSASSSSFPLTSRCAWLFRSRCEQPSATCLLRKRPCLMNSLCRTPWEAGHHLPPIRSTCSTTIRPLSEANLTG